MKKNIQYPKLCVYQVNVKLNMIFQTEQSAAKTSKHIGNKIIVLYTPEFIWITLIMLEFIGFKWYNNLTSM